MNKLRKELGIDDWLELVKEDKNLDSAYTSFAQYMYLLEQESQQLKEQLQQRNEVIDEAINYIKEVYDENYDLRTAMLDKQNVDELIEILQRYRGDRK